MTLKRKITNHKPKKIFQKNVLSMKDKTIVDEEIYIRLSVKISVSELSVEIKVA